jgi:hypothetical protein
MCEIVSNFAFLVACYSLGKVLLSNESLPVLGPPVVAFVQSVERWSLAILVS